MGRFLNTEIERQEYMEMRYKALDEEQYKQGDDLFDDVAQDKLLNAAEKKEKEKEDERKEENELKNQEAIYQEDMRKLLEDLGSV
jgi:hypothetical protein